MPIRPVRPGAYTLACGLALVAVIAAYANHFQGEFHFDDFHTIANNRYVRDLRSIPLFFSDPQTISALPANQSYRPLLLTTLAVDYWRGAGLDTTAFHVTSFALFLVQSVAMLVVFRRVMDLVRPHPSNRWIALFATAWYALHTANAETVNYIIARSEILSTLGAVLALWLFARGGRSRRWGLYLIPAAASTFAKEHGAMTAPLLFFYAALFERELSLRDVLRPRQFAGVVRETWPAFVVCGVVLGTGLWLARSFMAGGGDISRWHYLLAQPFVILHYVFAFALPVNLSADTDWKPITNPFDDRVIAGVIFIGVAVWLIAVTSRRRETRPIAYGLLWFFITLLPTSSVVPLAEVTNDHRMYFPFVGLTLAVTWALARALAAWPPLLAGRRGARAVVIGAGALLLAGHAAGTWQRNRVWRTEESLWLDVTRKSPENGRGLMTYGVVRMGKGDLDAAQRYFDRALRYVPRYAYLHVNLGILKGARGDSAEAERHFREAQQYDPTNPVTCVYYARWLDSVGRRDEALALAQRAVDLSPADLGARDMLTSIQERRRRAPEAPAVPQESPERWLALSLAHYVAGRYEECIDSSRQAVRMRPDYAEAFNNICAAQNALGRYAEAAAACERALAIKPDFPLARNNLAAARARRR